MKTFDYACDARVSRTITARTREEADREWELSCIAMNQYHGSYSQFVWGVPEVEEGQPVPPLPMSDSMKATCEQMRQRLWRDLCDKFGEEYVTAFAESQARWLEEHGEPPGEGR